MPTPKVSVIVPAYNGARFYESAMGSILLQNCPELETIVVDDGSTDGLDEIVRQGAADVRYLRQERKGPAAARNTGLRAASADLIAFLDIDDLWTAGHLARLCEALAQDPEAGIAHGLVRQFVLLPDGGRMLSGAYRMPYLGSCLFRRQVFEQCGGFDEDMAMGEDYDLMCRCWEHDVPKCDVDEVSLLYRRHEGNMTRGKNQAANLAVLQRRLQRIRSGAIDPAAPRRFIFQAYIGEIRNFAESHVEMPGQWNLSSAS
jgi:glycosyltransferase involved in cell wall biosynthesis